MIIVTGGAGFIGSVLVAELNRRGRKDILIVDDVDHDEKKHNLKALSYERLVGSEAFHAGIVSGSYDDKGVEALFHLGACSSTMETNWEYLKKVNVEYTKMLIEWSSKHDVRMVYASSAATYGNGEQGYSDAHELFDTLVPLNLYGKSKLDVDIWARDNGYLDTAVGVRYFNVFGPNEYHKEGMKSVIGKKYPDVAAGKGIELFRSYRKDYADGEQVRDFIYVKDAVAMTLFFFDMPHVNGVFNIGTGKAESWNAVARALGTASHMPVAIEYVDMPELLKKQYQYFTEADMTKLRNAGWADEVMPLEEAVIEYVRDYLAPHHHVGQVTY